ncbi:hypothetical protein GCM10023084_32490 [Streptomyces lacrimifluminis]|uniref:Uncharacterized protein n=1 Tax=Streptomyces lacrimifluminis TaxID=1500077 RepID=A0A917KVX8_9ACTN|nr:hypothetical protein GCM10012282_31210 [Streptomyces lacrimifluminis]
MGGAAPVRALSVRGIRSSLPLCVPVELRLRSSVACGSSDFTVYVDVSCVTPVTKDVKIDPPVALGQRAR